MRSLQAARMVLTSVPYHAACTERSEEFEFPMGHQKTEGVLHSSTPSVFRRLVRYEKPASRKNGSYFSSLSRGLHRAKRGVRVPDGSPKIPIIFYDYRDFLITCFGMRSLQAVGAYLPITFEYCRIRIPSGRASFDDRSLLFFRLHVTIFP